MQLWKCGPFQQHIPIRLLLGSNIPTPYKHNKYQLLNPQADHPLLEKPLLIEIWASIFHYL